MCMQIFKNSPGLLANSHEMYIDTCICSMLIENVDPVPEMTSCADRFQNWQNPNENIDQIINRLTHLRTGLHNARYEICSKTG